jgi:hypothetical protein
MNRNRYTENQNDTLTGRYALPWLVNQNRPLDMLGDGVRRPVSHSPCVVRTAGSQSCRTFDYYYFHHYHRRLCNVPCGGGNTTPEDTRSFRMNHPCWFQSQTRSMLIQQIVTTRENYDQRNRFISFISNSKG